MLKEIAALLKHGICLIATLFCNDFVNNLKKVAKAVEVQFFNRLGGHNRCIIVDKMWAQFIALLFHQISLLLNLGLLNGANRCPHRAKPIANRHYVYQLGII